MMKLVLTLILAVVLFFVYFDICVLVVYKRQPPVGQAYRESFHAEDCYADGLSCDRARILEDNEEALVERLRMIGKARRRVILSTFEWRPDDSGRDVIACLMEAAERGVDIQILVDGFHAKRTMYESAHFRALAAMPCVEIRVYNRSHLYVPWKIMGRMHDKYIIVDDSLYMLGGRNTHDDHLRDSGRHMSYDRDVLVYNTAPESRESSLYALENYFASVWALRDCRPFSGWDPAQTVDARAELRERCRSFCTRYPALCDPADYESMTDGTHKITLLANPIHVYAKEPTLFYALTELMKNAEGDIRIHTPYIMCNTAMYDALRDICAGNSRTSLMTNSAANNANPIGASDYLRNKDKLLDTGLTIYEYEGGVSYHAKSIVIGDRLSIIGSFNMDMRSVYLDTELMLAIDSEAVNEQLRAYMRGYEASAVRALDMERYEVPAGVQRQQFTTRQKALIHFINFFKRIRFLS